MPGSRLNNIECRLKSWWESPSTEFAFPVLQNIVIGRNSLQGDTPGLRGITNLPITFNYPLTVICGQNGSGKTTLLALAALGFHAPDGHHSYQARNYRPGKPKSYYTFADFFFRGMNDQNPTGLGILWWYRGGKEDYKLIQKTSKQWMRYYTRPERPVHYIGASRILPAIERNVLRWHFNLPKQKHRNVQLNENFRDVLCRVLGRTYSDATVVTSEKYSLNTCEFDSQYTSFNMGAGEDTLIEILHLLQETPDGSLIVIEEAELGLHPEAQKTFAQELLKIAWNKKLQIITSSHSATFIDSLPRISRVLLQRTGNATHEILKAPTTRYAMGFLRGDAQRELIIYCEDSFTESIIKEALSVELRKRTQIVGVGGDTQIAKQCGSHIRAGWPMKFLGLFDGDIGHNSAIEKLKNEFPEENKEEYIESVFHILPGGIPPEKWVLQEILENKKYIEALARDMKAEDKETVKSHLRRVEVLEDHHSIAYEFSRALGLGQKEVESMLIRASCHDNPKLSPVIERIEQILDGST